jgi:glucose-6-phosphate 1-epimerase
VNNPLFQAQASDWQGLPAIALTLNQSDSQCDSVLISLQGAQVLSWVSGGQERLFLSPKAAHDGKSAIRGGIPVCFPQFNQRGPLVKHGFARVMNWQGDAQAAQPLEGGEGGGAQITLSLSDTEATRAVWPHEFEAQLLVQLRPGALSVTLQVHNRGRADLPFTAALHSYLRVQEVEQATLHGLDGLKYWNAVADTHPVQTGAVHFGPETDCVYPHAEHALRLDHAQQAVLQISQDEAWSETVVWNPGAELCATLKDMQADSWQHMLCVEAAAIDAPVIVASGQRWQATQHLRVL